MPSSFTTNKSLEQPANGEYVDTWNVPLNGDMSIIDAAFGGVTNLNSTSGSSTLNAGQYQKLILNITATLVGNVTYSIPSGVGGQWIVRNATTGSFSVTIESAGGGTSVDIAQGTIASVYSDGTNIRQIAITLNQVEALFATRDVIAGTGLTGGGPLSSDVTLNADFASPENWMQQTSNKILQSSSVWSSMAEVTLTDQTNIPWNMQTGFDFIVTLGGNRTLSAPTNAKVGQKGRLIIAQNGTGGFDLNWNSVFKFANGLKPVLSTAANAIDVAYYDVRSSGFIIITFAGRGFASS